MSPACYCLPVHRLALVGFALALSACGSSDAGPAEPKPRWTVIEEALPGALLSIWGTSPSDVWVVGADARDGTGPLCLHYDGSAWTRVDTGETQGDLWWVFGFEGGPVFMGGAGGVILRNDSGVFTKMTTPGTDTVFGIWGTSPEELWAVGGAFDKTGFAWRLEGGTWTAEASLPAAVVADAALWKVFGLAANDAWMVGSNGVSFHWDGATLSQEQTGVGSSLFTVHANQKRFAAVGGLATGVIVENDGSGWKQSGDATPSGLTGVVLGSGDSGFAVGQYCTVYERNASGWHEDDIGLTLEQDLHGVWIDPAGGVWAAGGHTSSIPLTEGLLLHKGKAVAIGGI